MTDYTTSKPCPNCGIKTLQLNKVTGVDRKKIPIGWLCSNCGLLVINTGFVFRSMRYQNLQKGTNSNYFEIVSKERLDKTWKEMFGREDDKT